MASANAEHLPVNFDLTCWYISFRRVYEKLGSRSIALDVAKRSKTSEHWRVPILAKEAALELLRRSDPRPLTELVVTGQATTGRFFTHYGRFFFKWPRKDTTPSTTATSYAKLDWLIPKVQLDFAFSAADLTAHSARGQLSGQRRLLFFGLIQDVTPTRVTAIPYVIATPVEELGYFGPMELWGQYNEIFVDEVDSFERVRTIRSPSLDQLQRLRDIKEHEVKTAFQEIIGEPFGQVDWGGEHSDLVTTNLRWKDRRVATALAFKGPGRFHLLQPKHMGKNGDQIDRLFHEAAELYVVQHNHAISGAVRSMMRTYATAIRPCHFMLINGADTYRILRAYGKCGLRPPRSRTKTSI